MYIFIRCRILSNHTKTTIRLSETKPSKKFIHSNYENINMIIALLPRESLLVRISLQFKLQKLMKETQKVQKGELLLCLERTAFTVIASSKETERS